MNLLLWILAFFFGYTIKKEGENLNLSKTDARLVLDGDGKKISEKIGYLNEQLTDITKYDVKNAKYGAIGDGQRHPVYPTYATRSALQAKYPQLSDAYFTGIGINPTTTEWQTLEIDWCAIQSCLLDNDIAYVPVGDFSLTKAIDAIGKRLTGTGRSVSKLTQYTPSEAVLKVGSVPYIADLFIWHNSLPNSETVPNGVGIHVSSSLNDGAAFERLYIQNSTSGIYNSNTDGFHVYSASFRDIRVWRFNHSGVFLGGDGNTGCVVDNLYILNLNYDKSKMAALYAFYAKGYDDFSMRQLNIEGGQFDTGVTLKECANFSIDSVHFEQYINGKNYGSFFLVDGERSAARIKGISISYCTIDGSKGSNYALLNIGTSANVIIEGLKTKNITFLNSPILYRFYSLGNILSGAYIRVKMFRTFDGIFDSGDILASFTQPILREFNDIRYYWEDNGKRKFVGSAMPTTGSYNAQDEVINTGTKMELGKAGSKYVIEKWLRLTTGSNHVLGTDWLELRLFTGN
ncbi:hypothetical protein M4D76_24460 [Peribacillus frigoritolerans]|uniref:hypothetical protein n=1 Tax=Peribacillus frigoritolerans TaxID=450367 RepID=UPI0021A79503|nr:hypothetical protein [Peribacillus frigoritolerans]MCT1391419.1 hypothetical protein [Peribacillus frigoritolerans]